MIWTVKYRPRINLTPILCVWKLQIRSESWLHICVQQVYWACQQCLIYCRQSENFHIPMQRDKSPNTYLQYHQGSSKNALNRSDLITCYHLISVCSVVLVFPDWTALYLMLVIRTLERTDVHWCHSLHDLNQWCLSDLWPGQTSCRWSWTDFPVATGQPWDVYTFDGYIYPFCR